jgi:peptide-methionine (S)-S-oxide reductase
MVEQNWSRIGFGGGCHWCTEGVFASLKGVKRVDQGWVASIVPNNAFAEAVIVHFDADIIPLQDLISIHLFTHSCTSNHALRKKYRSAIYYFDLKILNIAVSCIALVQADFEKDIITQVIPFVSFKQNEEKYLDYFYKNPDNQFCRTYIYPKLDLLRIKYSKYLDNHKIETFSKVKD